MKTNKLSDAYSKYGNSFEPMDSQDFARIEADYLSSRPLWERRCGFHAGFTAAMELEKSSDEIAEDFHNLQLGYDNLWDDARKTTRELSTLQAELSLTQEKLEKRANHVAELEDRIGVPEPSVILESGDPVRSKITGKVYKVEEIHNDNKVYLQPRQQNDERLYLMIEDIEPLENKDGYKALIDQVEMLSKCNLQLSREYLKDREKLEAQNAKAVELLRNWIGPSKTEGSKLLAETKQFLKGAKDE